MSRGLWDRFGAHGDDGDAELDALLADTWADAAAAVAKVVDIEAGKAALLSTVHRQETSDPARHHGSENSDALAAVCEEVDSLLAVITAESRINMGPAHTTVMPYLQTARARLNQLRAGLRRRSLGRRGALQLTSNVEHALGQAGRTLAALPPGALPAGDPEAADLAGLISDLRQRLPALNRQIERLFDETGDAAPRVPVPQ
jgi:hypothetical protein